MVRLFDLRVMREIEDFREHSHEIISLAWHPYEEGKFVSADFSGKINLWDTGCRRAIETLYHG
jgi:polyadenylation factor subunit 2